MKLSLSQGILRGAQYTIIFFLLTTIFARPSSTFAQGPTPTDDEVNKIAKQLYCPVCESTPLDVCPTEACRQWRDVIHSMLSEGRSEAEIKQHFVEQYGVRVLNEPPNRWISYLVPGVAILLGALMLLRGFQTWKKPVVMESASAQRDAEPVQDQYIARMEEELRKRNESSH